MEAANSNRDRDHKKEGDFLPNTNLSPGALHVRRHVIILILLNPFPFVAGNHNEVPFLLKEVITMMRLVVPSIALLALSVGTVPAGADLKSGLEVGAKAGAFQVKDCTGPNKGKSLCFV